MICDNIRSLENIGSIFRTADALGVDKIFLCGISGSSPTNFRTKAKRENINPKLYSKLVGDKPPNHKISKTALGAEKTVPFEYYAQTWRLIEKLKKEKVFVVALENNIEEIKTTASGGVTPLGGKSILYTKLNYIFPLALIIGNEVKGISKTILDKSDKIIYLPMQGQKESLNVSVAFGVAGYYINKFRIF